MCRTKIVMACRLIDVTEFTPASNFDCVSNVTYASDPKVLHYVLHALLCPNACRSNVVRILKHLNEIVVIHLQYQISLLSRHSIDSVDIGNYATVTLSFETPKLRDGIST